jgi:DNA-binding MarR family transcriptional regulator
MNKLSKFKPAGAVESTVTAKLLYLILNDIAGRNGEVIIPQRKISNALGISKGAVSRNLRRLEKIGAIAVVAQYHSDGGRAANKYILRK